MLILGKAQRNAVNITNSLEKLIPLGTLFFTNPPRLPQNGIKAQDGWSWFDPPYLLSNPSLRSLYEDRNFSFISLIQDLCYFMERLYIKITYKFVSNDLVAMRVYFVPNDIEGARYLETLRQLYRYSKPSSWHATKYKAIMKQLLTVLDYSKNHWNLNIDTNLLIFDALQPFKQFDIKDIGSIPYLKHQSTVDFHLSRLHNSDPFYKINKSESLNLEERLTSVYDSIQFKKDYAMDVFQQCEEIKGLKSSLYLYQVETIAKMYSNETQQYLKLLPNWQYIESRKFYLNILDLTLKRSGEFYTTPRGGILAENMGLGKTFICLALICLTKDEISEIPPQYLKNDVRDYKILRLTEQCIRVINTNSIQWKPYIDSLPQSCIKQLYENPGVFYINKEQSQNKRSLREKPVFFHEKFYLTSATLIICPDNLFQQWIQEIGKHVETKYLNILLLDNYKFISSARELCKYDVILMSVSTYVSESPNTSQLTKVFWKRLIIDEGHSLNQRSTKVVDFSKELKAERKWAVTGTPTSGMTKLHVDEQNEIPNEDINKDYTIKRSYNPKDDLSRLGYLIMNFFQIEPWCNLNNLWNKNVVKPFVEDKYGSKSSLSSLIGDLVIRHSSNQIKTDFLLPPLFHKPILLEPSYYNKVSINIFTAVLAINAISSEREGKDYMFDASNKVDLRRLVTNLQRATFYWTGFSIEDLENMIYLIESSLQKLNSDGTKYYTIEDLELLEKSLDVCKKALRDKTWRIVSTIHEMEYFIEGLNQMSHENFGISICNKIPVFGGPQLYALQQFYYKNRFNSNDSLKVKMQQNSSEFWKSYWKETSKKNTERSKKNDGQNIEIMRVEEELKLQDTKISLKTSVKTKYDDPNSLKDSNGRIIHESLDTDNSNGFDTAKLLGTSSAKLSYIVSRLLEHEYTGIKSIVFFEFEDSAYYLSEALDLLGISYTLYATSVNKNERFKKINEFTNAQGGYCLIMDLKLASHGLTITAATHVYFLNPVWKRSIEAQAIKRAHRIGQNKPVHVETLILKGTLEEEMFNKRLNVEDELQTPVADDDQIQKFISKFEFSGLKGKKYTEFQSVPITNFKAINMKTFEPYQLHEPYGIVNKDKLHWCIPLFSQKSQLKISQTSFQLSKVIDRLKKHKNYNDEPLINTKPQKIVEQIINNNKSQGFVKVEEVFISKKRPPISNVSSKIKKVRFSETF